MPKRIRLVALIATCLLLYLSSVAQILKVDKLAALDDTAGVFDGTIGLNFSLNNRNSTEEQEVTFTTLSTHADLSYLSHKHVYYLFGKVRYFQSTGGPLLSTGYAHARSNFYRKHKLSYEVFIQEQYDQGRNLDHRFLVGGGLRYRLHDKIAMGLGSCTSVNVGSCSVTRGITFSATYRSSIAIYQVVSTFRIFPRFG